METAAPIPKPTMNNSQKEIKYINEYKINSENSIYTVKIGKIITQSEELTIFVKNENENIINREYYQSNFSLENLQKMNKIFRQFDTIDETIDTLKDIISEKKLTIKKENDILFITFKMKKLGKGEEEFNLKLEKKSVETGKIIDNLITNFNNLKLEIEELKNENKQKKTKKYTPILENGWLSDPYFHQEFIVCKNNDGLVCIQGLVTGDWSKKIFTLEKEFRSKYRLTFPVIANQNFNRVDILPNGDVYLSFHGNLGVQGEGWVNLSGITYYISE